MQSLFRKPVVLLLHGYRLLISPFLGERCRFEPTCSRYAEQAVMTHGVFKGLFLAIRRIGRCHPWNEGGYDPVPGSASKLADDKQSACCSRSDASN